MSQHVLRITTAGSVDDGKSTLIGRLLYELQAVQDDQWEALQKARTIDGQPDLSLLTDGLKSEREQGITIDVAYKYFSSKKRKFVLADAPGHVQYTRNMVTAASRADAAIILIDARHGVVEQTRRHAYLIHLLRVPHVIVAINKIDAINYDSAKIQAIETDFRTLSWFQDAPSLHFVPLSALRGDNVTQRSQATNWYQGPALLDLLETLEPPQVSHGSAKLPVQLILRDALGQRFASGTLQEGTLQVGQAIRIWPSQQESTIAELWVQGQAAQQAEAGQAIAVRLSDERDLERGSLLGSAEFIPQSSRQFEAQLVWFDDEPWRSEERYILRLGTQTSRVQVTKLHYRFDLETLEAHEVETLHRNDIAQVQVHSARSLLLEDFANDRNTGSFILIDPRSFRTVAAGLITDRAPDDEKLRLGPSIRLVEQLQQREQDLVEKTLQIPRSFFRFNTTSLQTEALEKLWEAGWSLSLERCHESEQIHKLLSLRGLGTHVDGSGI